MPIVLQKFEITLNDGNGGYKLEEIEGTPVQNDYGIVFFVHRTNDGGYRVSEQSTGLAFTPVVKLKRDAIQKMHEIIKERGLDEANKIIKERYEEVRPTVSV